MNHQGVVRLSGQFGEIGNLGSSDLLGERLFEGVTLCTGIRQDERRRDRSNITIVSARQYLYSKV